MDALTFRPDGHLGTCMVHRRAFRALLGRSPERAGCEAFFRTHPDAFSVAARRKIGRGKLPSDANLHLNSRDIRAALDGAGAVDRPGDATP